MSVTVRELPPQHVAYMRYVGPYGPHGIPQLWGHLRTWMEAHGLSLASTVRLGVAHDNPAITAAAQLRYDACVVVPAGFPADASVNVADIPGGRYAVALFEGGPQEIETAWDRVFAGWLPGSGFQPDARPCFELYRGEPGVPGRPGVFRCELHLPVRPL